MSCARSSSKAKVGDPSSNLGSSSSTCSFSTYLSGGCIEKYIGGLRAIIEGICGSFGKKILRQMR